jgi:hypothetical protein
MYSIKQDSMALTNLYRAKVTKADSTTGEIKVLIPAALGPDSEVSISYWGRKATNGSWSVPNVGDLIVVGVEDANFTNVYWVQTDAVGGPQGPQGPVGPQGLVFLQSWDITTLTNQVNMVGAFSNPNYTAYRLIGSRIETDGFGGVYLRFMNGTTPDVSTSYDFQSFTVNGTGGTTPFNATAQIGVSEWYIVQKYASVLRKGSFVLDIFDPNVATNTTAIGQSIAYLSTNPMIYNQNLAYSGAFAHDGFLLFGSSSMKWSGLFTLYGYQR